ncbi:hypothetical protein [Pseudoclavibacter helvolus]|uniref:hypothetical protein n=1 Tax=Pseudoclavibacter helvolus TaxID=255205 RepID=UPI000837EEFB|nr:hypothetical protein [Pseudoclavibacter helvolus]
MKLPKIRLQIRAWLHKDKTTEPCVRFISKNGTGFVAIPARQWRAAADLLHDAADELERREPTR